MNISFGSAPKHTQKHTSYNRLGWPPELHTENPSANKNGPIWANNRNDAADLQETALLSPRPQIAKGAGVGNGTSFGAASETTACRNGAPVRISLLRNELARRYRTGQSNARTYRPRHDSLRCSHIRQCGSSETAARGATWWRLALGCFPQHDIKFGRQLTDRRILHFGEINGH